MKRLQSKTNLISPQIRKIWNLAVKAPFDVEAKWLHGDLHPGNILIENGKITGIIDWGDITSGNIATDLASIWMLFSDSNTRKDIGEKLSRKARCQGIFKEKVFLIFLSFGKRGNNQFHSWFSSSFYNS